MKKQTKEAIVVHLKGFGGLIMLCAFVMAFGFMCSRNTTNHSHTEHHIEVVEDIDTIPTVEIGQMWTRIDTSNPFESVKIDTVIILDVKREYAKVNWNGRIYSIESDAVTCCGRTLLTN